MRRVLAVGCLLAVGLSFVSVESAEARRLMLRRHAAPAACPVSQGHAAHSHAVAGTELAYAEAAAPAAASKPDIVDTAVGAGSFKTLVAAVQAAGLVDTLKSAGPFTVFAPTDEAFAKLPAGTVEGLLKDKEKLAAILTYHVVPGKVLSGDVVKLTSAKTVNGQSVTIDAKSGVKVDGANVVKADIECGNGVIHVIDAVILPK
jgi:uncharacterized surface protein with fasciclin (FAS1) repeats